MNYAATCQSARNRRELLRAGIMGGCALSLSPLVQAEAANFTRKPRARSVVLVFLGGGLSQLDSFDPKPNAPAEFRGEYRPIHTSLPGVMIGERLPRLSRCMDKLAIVRSVSHNCDHHEAAANWLLSGRFGSPFGDHPAMGAVVAHELGGRGSLPAYVAVPRNPAFTWELGTSAFLGPRYESFPSGMLNRSKNPLRTFERAPADARALCTEARRAFAIEYENLPTCERYGQTAFGQSCLLARRLVERGVRFITVSFCGWDYHANLWNGLDWMLPQFDLGLSALLEDLHSSGLLDETLVVACGEFGRTPKINANAGRDHWPAAASLLFAGAGVRGGQVIGKTDKHGAYVTDHPISPADVAHTIYDSLGIDARGKLATPDGRRRVILDQGEVVERLFG